MCLCDEYYHVFYIENQASVAPCRLLTMLHWQLLGCQLQGGPAVCAGMAPLLDMSLTAVHGMQQVCTAQTFSCIPESMTPPALLLGARAVAVGLVLAGELVFGAVGRLAGAVGSPLVAVRAEGLLVGALNAPAGLDGVMLQGVAVAGLAGVYVICELPQLPRRGQLPYFDPQPGHRLLPQEVALLLIIEGAGLQLLGTHLLPQGRLPPAMHRLGTLRSSL